MQDNNNDYSEIMDKAALYSSLFEKMLKNGPGHGYVAMRNFESHEYIGYDYKKLSDRINLVDVIDNHQFAVLPEHMQAADEIAPYVLYGPEDNSIMKPDEVIYCLESLEADFIKANFIFLMNYKGAGMTWFKSQGEIKSFNLINRIALLEDNAYVS